MNQKTETVSTHLLPTQNDNLERIATSLEALVGIQRKMMAELYGLRAVTDELFEIERVRWLQELELANTKDIKKLEDRLK